VTEISDYLRIIARDGGRLDIADRAAIALAADELEQAWRATIEVQRALIAANEHRIALNDQLRETRAKLPAVPVDELPWQMQSGWYRLEMLS
jgi:hypothetical protein